MTLLLKIGKRAAWAVSAIMMSVAFLWAQPQITARLSANEIPLSGQATLTFEISGVENVGQFPGLSIPGLDIRPAGQSRSVQIVNGVVSSVTAIHFAITPQQVGAFTIPGVTLSGGGQSISSDPVALRVVADPSSAAPKVSSDGPSSIDVPAEGLKPVFLTATVDKSKVVVGQQIILKVQFLTRPNAGISGRPRYSEPDMAGFLVESMKQQDYSTTINGIPYQVNEIRYALFPTTDGEFAIGSARVELQMQSEVDPFDPNSFFQSFFGRPKMVKLNTRAIPIQVRALPKVKPAQFSGAVGRFRIKAAADTTTPEVGKPFNYIVTIEGTGNIKTLKEPAWPPLNAFKQYETISTTKINNEGQVLQGSKEYKVLLMPQVSGTLALPPVKYVYFNPDANDFETVSTQEIVLQVKTGTLPAADAMGPITRADPGTPAQGIQVVDKNIRFLKTGAVTSRSKPVRQQWPFLAGATFPPLFALGAFMAARQSRRRMLYAGYYKSKGAVKAAYKSLRHADKNIAALESAPFYGLLYNSLANMLSAKFHIAGSDLVWDRLSQILSEKKINERLLADIKEVMEAADMARFGVASFELHDKRNALQKAKAIIEELESV